MKIHWAEWVWSSIVQEEGSPGLVVNVSLSVPMLRIFSSNRSLTITEKGLKLELSNLVQQYTQGTLV